jgi:hypothetical protein
MTRPIGSRPKSTVMPIVRSCGAIRRRWLERARGSFSHSGDLVTIGSMPTVCDARGLDDARDGGSRRACSWASASVGRCSLADGARVVSVCCSGYGRSSGLRIRWKVVSGKWTAGDHAKRLSALLTTFSGLLLYRGDAAIGVGSSPTFGLNRACRYRGSESPN